MTTTPLLQQAIAAARAGQRVEARQLLIQLLEQDEHNLQAWLWLSGVVDDPHETRVCLENVLELDPNNQQAQKGLAWLDQKYGKPTPAPEPPPTPTPAPAAPPTAAPAPAQPAPTPAAVTATTTHLELPNQLNDPSQRAPMPQIVETQQQQVAKPLGMLPAVKSSGGACPYCGTPTEIKQKHCPKCHRSLMIKLDLPNERSAATSVLSVLWLISAVLTGISGLGYILLALVVINDPVTARSIGMQFGAGGTFAALMPGIIVLGIAGLWYSVSRALKNRQAWAWYLVAILAIIGFIGSVGQFITGLVGVSELTPMLAQQGISSTTATSFGRFFTSILICSFLLNFGYLVLVWLSRKDFTKASARFVGDIDVGDDRAHFNNALAYSKQGMHYQAVKEWEAAVSKSARDPQYLHALGLGYADIREFDRAFETLDRALQFAPNNQEIVASRAAVEKMAAKHRSR